MAKSKPPIKAKYIEDPETLLRYWDEYKEFIDSMPDFQQVATGKGVVTIAVKKPYLKCGFEAYVYRKYNITVDHYLDDKDGSYDAYRDAVSYIRREWRTDQLEGAITGRYKAANLIAQLNNVVQQQEVEHKGEQKREIIFRHEPLDEE